MPGITLAGEIAGAVSQSGRRRLLIPHYAGHAIAGSTPDSPIITPKIGQEPGGGPEIDMSFIKNTLKELASKSLGLDVLLVIDSCCAGIAGHGGKVRVRGWSSWLLLHARVSATQDRMNEHSRSTGVKPLPSFWR